MYKSRLSWKGNLAARNAYGNPISTKGHDLPYDSFSPCSLLICRHQLLNRHSDYLTDFGRRFYTMICSSFSRRSTGLWSSCPKSMSLSKGCFSVTTLFGFSRGGAQWLPFFAAGTSWLCFPSYVVTTALGSVGALSTCLRTLHPGLVHL